jgi:hypothetical protein
MRAFPLLLLGGVLAAQTSEPRAPQPQPPAPAAVPRAQQRASDDAQAACRNFLLEPHAFTGTCRFNPYRGGGAAEDTVRFRGAWKDGVELFSMDNHSVLTHGPRQVVRVLDRPWTPPQGDAPDCPLSPRVLATHLPTATIKSCQATSHADRPAMRVHAVWTGKEAGALAVETSVPHAKGTALLESMPALLKRVPDRVVVDATICFDPATRTLLAATLRIALLGEAEPPDEPPPVPLGLPALTKEGLANFTFDVVVQQPTLVPMPVLEDARLRALLGLPVR